MALGVFIWCHCFDTKEMEFTCMATWFLYKTAYESITDGVMTNFLCFVLNVYIG